MSRHTCSQVFQIIEWLVYLCVGCTGLEAALLQQAGADKIGGGHGGVAARSHPLHAPTDQSQLQQGCSIPQVVELAACSQALMRTSRSPRFNCADLHAQGDAVPQTSGHLMVAQRAHLKPGTSSVLSVHILKNAQTGCDAAGRCDEPKDIQTKCS